MEEIVQIQGENKGNYGYRRITSELEKRGKIVNHKKVLRLTKKLGLQVQKRGKRGKYNSYKGDVGKVADNIINRDFIAEEPLKKCYTDITEFKINNEKVYVSPIVDGYNGEVIACNISFSPNLEQIRNMLSQLTKETYTGMILHSDQGWQYQHKAFIKFLEGKNITQSMSRKGTSADNGLMESFFGVMKTEMFYGYEKTFKDKYELKAAIEEYIEYYNHKRIRMRLGGLSPVNYRKKKEKIEKEQAA